jgi:hypothetical protein
LLSVNVITWLLLSEIYFSIYLSWRCCGLMVTLGVSICLDTKKSQSRPSSKSRQFQKVSLDNQDISIKIEISRFSLDERSQDRTFWSRSRFFETCRDLLRFFETCQDFCDFSGFLNFFLDLDSEITWFLIYLNRDIYFSCINLWWVRM